GGRVMPTLACGEFVPMKTFLKKAWQDIIGEQKNLELYLVLSVIVLIFVADIFDFDTKAASTEILLAALAILVYGMIDTRHYNEQIDKTLSEQSRTLKRFEKRISQIAQASAYFNRSESYDRIFNVLGSVKESVDIVSYHNLRAADAKRSRYFEALFSVIRDRHVNHRRIVWNLDHLLWLNEILSMGWDDLDEFSVRFYRANQAKQSLTTFDIFDQRVVFLGQGWLMEGHIEIVSPEVALFFRSYFSGLWNSSVVVKERGKPANKDVLNALIDELAPNHTVGAG
ncbi:hypothetical protein D6817_05030, partial [Candidatus Pacearchaeota archaeon]